MEVASEMQMGVNPCEEAYVPAKSAQQALSHLLPFASVLTVHVGDEIAS